MKHHKTNLTEGNEPVIEEICPLLAMAAHPVAGPAFCLGKKCGWWGGNECAVKGLQQIVSGVHDFESEG